MDYIKGFGYLIYRLQQAQEGCEFLLYDVDEEKYYQFSKTRFYDILKLKIEKSLNMSLTTYMIKQELIDFNDPKIDNKCNKIYQSWIREEIILLDNINYKPIDKQIYQEEDNLYYNIYEKPKLYNFSEKGDFESIKKVIMNLVSNDEQGYLYFCSWLAWQIQNPTKRLATSIIFQGEQGTGKTLLCNHVLRYIFGKNFAEINQSDINKEYNDYIMGKQLIVANEVIYSNSHTSTSDRLKNYVTDKYVSINRKYRDSMNVINYAHWIFTSNNQVPIKIERGDRRYTVFKSKKLGPEGFELYQKLSMDNDEVKHFLYYLQNLDITFDLVNTPYITSAKEDIIDATSNSVESFINSINEQGGIKQLNNNLQEASLIDAININYLENSNNSYIKLDILYQLYVKYCSYNGFRGKYGRNQFTSLLKHHNKHITVIKDKDNKSHRCMKLEENQK